MDRFMINDTFLFGADGGAGDVAHTFGAEKGETDAALLLPAVQSAREAARPTTCGDAAEPGDAFAAETDWTGFTLVELLVV